MNVARINFSHSGEDHEYVESLVHMVKNAHGRHAKLSAGSIDNQKIPLNLRGILVDTKGPEIRTRPLQGNADVIRILPG